jgi:hypothetical protein
MKNFITAMSTMVYQANAWGADDNTWLETTSGTAENTKLVNFAEEFIWEMDTTTVLNEDSGISYLRIAHTLTTDIFADDEIIFEVAF